MEIHKVLERRITDLESDFHAFFMASMNEPSEKNVHKLRVIIKKWKALAKLLVSIDPHSDTKKWLEPIKKVFKEAGKLRDFQIQAEIVISKYKKDKKKIIAESFQKQAEELAHRFRTFESQFSLIAYRQGLKESIEHIRGLPIDLVYKRINQYFKRNTKELLRLNIACQQKRDLLHAYRIQLKSFYYNLIFILESKKQTALFEEQIALLDEFLDVIGVWHDHAILILLLQSERASPNKIDEHVRLMHKWQGKLDQYWDRLDNTYEYFYQNLSLILTFQKLQEHKTDRTSFRQINIKRSLK